MDKGKIIEVKQLSFAYPGKQVLEDVHLHFHAQRFSVLLGINGSGKSTLFKIIAGLLKGYTGDVYWQGEDLFSFKAKEKARRIGFLPQFHQHVFSYTVEQLMLTGRAAFNRFGPHADDYKQVARILEELEIPELRYSSFATLSGGQQQLVMIGRLLMQEPELLLLDEPTNHLDVYYQNFLMKKLKEYIGKGLTVVAVMHNPTLAYQYADDFYFVHDRTIISNHAHAPDPQLLERVYGIPFLHVDQGNNQIVLPDKLL